MSMSESDSESRSMFVFEPVELFDTNFDTDHDPAFSGSPVVDVWRDWPKTRVLVDVCRFTNRFPRLSMCGSPVVDVCLDILTGYGKKRWKISKAHLQTLFPVKEYRYFFLFLHKNMLLYSLEVPQWGPSNECLQHMFLWRNKKNLLPTLIRS